MSNDEKVLCWLEDGSGCFNSKNAIFIELPFCKLSIVVTQHSCWLYRDGNGKFYAFENTVVNWLWSHQIQLNALAELKKKYPEVYEQYEKIVNEKLL